MYPCQVNQETENRRLRLPILGSKAYATAKSSQHCFLGAQTGKHLLPKQNVSENNQKHFLLLGNKKMFLQQKFRSRSDRETFRETFFLNNVSATIFLRLRGLNYRVKAVFIVFALLINVVQTRILTNVQR